MGDRLGISGCLEDWGVLLDKANPHSCVLAHSVTWIESQSNVSRDQFSSPEKVLDFLKWRCRNIPSLVGHPIFYLPVTNRTQQGPRLKPMLQQGSYAPSMLRLIESLDAFVDFGPSFQEYIASQEVYTTCRSIGLHQRKRNSVHPKVRYIILLCISQKATHTYHPSASSL